MSLKKERFRSLKNLLSICLFDVPFYRITWNNSKFSCSLFHIRNLRYSGTGFAQGIFSRISLLDIHMLFYHDTSGENLCVFLIPCSEENRRYNTRYRWVFSIFHAFLFGFSRQIYFLIYPLFSELFSCYYLFSVSLLNKWYLKWNWILLNERYIDAFKIFFYLECMQKYLFANESTIEQYLWKNASAFQVENTELRVYIFCAFILCVFYLLVAIVNRS